MIRLQVGDVVRIVLARPFFDTYDVIRVVAVDRLSDGLEYVYVEPRLKVELFPWGGGGSLLSCFENGTFTVFVERDGARV